MIWNLHRVTMLQDKDAWPYENAQISVVSMLSDEIAPAQDYVLQSEFEKVQALKWALAEHFIDLFKLDGYIKIWLEGNDEPIDVLPPIVEESLEANGEKVNILNDGLHRVYLARRQWSPIQVVFIWDIPSRFPYYAYPLPDGWAGVKMVQELPQGMIKKVHRIEDNKSLYRDFNSGGFQNVGGPRPPKATAK